VFLFQHFQYPLPIKNLTKQYNPEVVRKYNKLILSDINIKIVAKPGIMDIPKQLYMSLNCSLSQQIKFLILKTNTL